MVSKAAEGQTLGLSRAAAGSGVLSAEQRGKVASILDGALELGSRWASQFRTPDLLEAGYAEEGALPYRRRGSLGKNVRASLFFGVM